MSDLRIEVKPTTGRFAEVRLHFVTVDGPDLQTVYLPVEDAHELADRMRPRIEAYVIGAAHPGESMENK